MNIKNIRENAGITQRELAMQLNVAQNTIWQWETGRASPRAELLPEIASILGCTIDELFAEEVEVQMNISVARKNAGITQRELAMQLNVAQNTVWQWETGRTLPRAELLPKLASVLGCTIDELFRKEDGGS